MRIGILTFHKPVNYGAFLQAFSLSERLKKEFPNDEIEIIDYIAPKEARKIYINILRDFKHSGIKGGIKSIRKTRMFKKCQKHLTLSDRSFCTDDLEKLYEYIQARYDRLIIGSDAVFNWDQNGFPTAFIPNYDFGMPVFTYAASVHGLKYYEVDKEKIRICKEAFAKMKLIGFRDSCTEKFVHYCLPTAKTAFCCDPTLFIDCDKIQDLAGDYSARIKRKYNVSLDKEYIVIMAPDSNLIQRVAEKYGNEYTLLTLFKSSKYTDAFLYDLNPFEWAMVLGGASATITSYFHGTLLSLVQGTPTIVLDYSGYEDDYEGKLSDLLKTRFKLAEFYFNKPYAASFGEDPAFYTLFDSMLGGEYTEKIEAAVQTMKKSFDSFVGELASCE